MSGGILAGFVRGNLGVIFKLLVFTGVAASIFFTVKKYGEQTKTIENLQGAVKIYSQEWEAESERKKILYDELSKSREGVVKATEEISKHDFKKIYKRHPDMLIDIVNNNTKRLFLELKSSSAGKDKEPGPTETR